MLRALVLVFSLYCPLHGYAEPVVTHISGKILVSSIDTMIIEVEKGKQIIVEITEARNKDLIGSPLTIGRDVLVVGHPDGTNFVAESIQKGGPK